MALLPLSCPMNPQNDPQLDRRLRQAGIRRFDALMNDRDGQAGGQCAVQIGRVTLRLA
jgi:hypothetical protein